MYSLKEKENIIKKIKKKANIDELVLTTGISKTTILKWKKELELRQYIRKLIYSGNLEEAKKEVEKIKGKVNEPIRNSLLIKIAREEGDLETEKRLLDRLLEIDPNNVKAISNRIRIAREEGDLETQKRLLDRQFELEPNDVKAMSSRIRIAREEGDTETRKRLLDRLLELEPNNVISIIGRIEIAREERKRNIDTEINIDIERKLLDRLLELEPNNIKAISSRIAIAREKGDTETRKRLLDRLLELEPNNIKAISSRIRIAIKEKDEELQQQLTKKLAEIGLTEDRELEDLLSQQYISQEEADSQEENTSSIKGVRKLIYESSDIVQASEQIKELLEGQDELDRELALAELFIKTGLQSRAEKSLKTYKRKIEALSEKQEDLRIVKKALELIRNTKTRKLQWDELWRTLENRQTQIHAKEEQDER